MSKKNETPEVTPVPDVAYNNAPNPIFVIEKIYLKDASLEVPHAPMIFTQRDTPEISVQLNNQSEPLENGLFHVTLQVNVRAKIQDKTLFMVELVQAGVFRIQNIPTNDVTVLLNVSCPNILFPYAREAISSEVTRAGFPPVVLNPVSFEALYQQRLQQIDNSSSTLQ